MVLLTMVPGGSQQALGTVISIGHKRSMGALWQNDKLLPEWQVVPTMKFEKEMLQELSVDACQAGLFRELRRLDQDSPTIH